MVAEAAGSTRKSRPTGHKQQAAAAAAAAAVAATIAAA